MPHINQLRESRFLKKEDCGAGILVTIKDVTQENVAKEGAPEDLKWSIHFQETDKPMVLNSTNAQIIAQITKAEETEGWAGHKVVLYNDPNISFGGKIVGGIRVRAPRGQAAKAAATAPSKPAPAPVAPQEAASDDDVPF